MIYYVEDDRSIRELVVYTLQNTGFDAVGFENGEKFFSALQNTKPNLILLDIMLPGEDGMKIMNVCVQTFLQENTHHHGNSQRLRIDKVIGSIRGQTTIFKALWYDGACSRIKACSSHRKYRGFRRIHLQLYCAQYK